MLSKVTIRRFKSIADLSLSFGQLNVLVGGNNSGKSTVLHAMQFAVSVAQTLRNSRWTRGRKPGSIASNELIYAPLRDITALAPNGKLGENVANAIQIRLQDDIGICECTARRGRNKNTVFMIEGEALGKRLEDMVHPYSVFVPGLSGISEQEEYRSVAYVRKAAARGDANGVLRNVLALLLGDTEKWNRFVEDLRQVFPECDLVIVSDRNEDEFIDVRLRFEGIDTPLPVDAAGTGILQAIQILSYVNLYEPAVLLLDEPDAHLHPNNQRKIASLLTRLTDRRQIQVVLTTHSRHMLDALSGVAKIRWLNKGEVVGTDPEYLDVLMGLGALDQAELLRSGRRGAVVLAEDSNTAPLSTLLQASRLCGEEVYIWSYKGCTKEDTAIVITKFIRSQQPNMRVIIHRDRDYLANDEVSAFTARMSGHGIIAFITDGTSVESYFLHPAHLAKLNPDLSPQEFAEMIQQATEDMTQDSINTMTDSNFEAMRRTGRGSASHAAAEARQLYRSDTVRYRHAKKVLARVKDLFRLRTGSNLVVFSPSEYVAVTQFSQVARALDAERQRRAALTALVHALRTIAQGRNKAGRTA